MNEYEEDLADEIRIRIWSGFHSLRDILEMLADCDVDDAGKQMLAEFAESELQAKREAEATWPTITDCVRLDAVFDSLNELGIVALHNVGLSMSDGFHYVDVAIAAAPRYQVKGYCFYHAQDVDRAVLGYGLLLAYGDLTGKARERRAIGEQVKAELERQGFVVEWDGDEEERIKLPEFVWQRCSA